MKKKKIRKLMKKIYCSLKYCYKGAGHYCKGFYSRKGEMVCLHSAGESQKLTAIRNSLRQRVL